jgi:hypothetical protein
VYSIPLAVKANVGIPLGIVMAPSEHRDVFSLFADVLAEKGFSRGDLFELPLLSDAGNALRSYAEGNAGRRGYHRYHDLCDRHLLESLGSGTIVALLARLLLFTPTEEAFREIYPQTIADFVLGCRQNVISAAGRKKFGELFGVDLAGWNGDGSPRTNAGIFKGQALWSERGITFGVAACTNHIDGTHGRLNQQVKHLRCSREKFAIITSALIESAANWSDKVQRGWRRITGELEASAHDHHLNFPDCPEDARCDKGLLLSRRLGRQVLCVHIILSRGWPDERPPAQFDLSTTGLPDVSFTQFDGEWTLEAPPKKPKFGPDEDGLEGAPLGEETTRAGRTVRRIRHELTFLDPRREFKYSRDQMLVRLVQIQELTKHTYKSRLSTNEIEERANSIFLLQYVDVVQNNAEWYQL